MRQARDMLFGQLALLLMPRELQRCAPASLLGKQGDEGLSGSMRTPQGGLENPSHFLAIQCDFQDKSNRWSVAREGLNRPVMDISKVLALFLASIQLKTFLSQIVMDHLCPQFNWDPQLPRHHHGRLLGYVSACR